jgi:cytoskeletal protein RodZ
MCTTILAAQSPVDKVATAVDRDSIMMGEEIKLQLTVDATPQDLVVFPPLQNIGPLEVIESYPVDTIRENDRMRLFKEYGITQFDSGDYYIPQLKILKNQKQLLSDSLLVIVREVQTDTTVQKMYPIKADIENDYPSPFNWKGLLWLLLWIPLGILFYLLSRKRTHKTYEETLPPYEWSKYRLNKLAESKLTENRAWKAYYTELTYIVRRYIDNKVYGHALENTTAELIANIERETAAKGVSITDKTKARLAALLQKADLIKFAGQSGDAITAKDDLGVANDIIYNIHQVLPPPSEEELLLDVEYRRKQDRKRKIKTIGLYAGGILLAIVIAVAAWIAVVGMDDFKDQLFGNQLREYYEGERYTSSYGAPEITITTPEILVRETNLQATEQFKAATKEIDAFKLNDLDDDLFVVLATYQVNSTVVNDEKPIPREMFTEPVYQSLEEQGATNILMLDEPVELNGIDGMKLEGTFEYSGDQYDYEAYLYANGAAIQQVLVGNVQDDTEEEEKQFGRLLREQIVQSIQIKKPQPSKEERP